jgi:hypothetical protein
MKNLYDQPAYEEIANRILQVSADSVRQWGKMDPAQMLAHCCEAFKVPLSNQPVKRMLTGYLVGWMAKGMLFSEKPWKQNLPTAPGFIVTDAKILEKEKLRLLSMLEAFYTRGAANTGKYPHPFFGKLSAEQWGKMMYKHLDHHLKQFNC